MFSFILTELYVGENGIEIRDLKNLDDDLISSFLDYFENRVYIHLKENNLKFKYVQSSLEHNVFESCLEYVLKGSMNYNVFNLTQHPRYVGSIIIDYFINYNSSIKNYVISYENPIAENWLNSRVCHLDVIKKIETLNTKTTLKQDVKITFIRIYNSDLINFKQVNLGSKSPLFKIDY